MSQLQPHTLTRRKQSNSSICMEPIPDRQYLIDLHCKNDNLVRWTDTNDKFKNFMSYHSETPTQKTQIKFE